MTQKEARIRQEMKAPRTAAVAGILFSFFAISSFLLFRISVSPNPLSQPTGMIRHTKTISLALYLLPFAGDDYVGLVMNYVGAQDEALTARHSKP